MVQSIIHIALLVRDYDEAIAFYTEKLGFRLLEDTAQPEQQKRWVVVAPPGGTGATLLLARAATPEQEHFIGDQAGGRVFLFLRTDDFWRDYRALQARGVRFVREPKQAEYGTVAVFEDLAGTWLSWPWAIPWPVAEASMARVPLTGGGMELYYEGWVSVR